MGAVRPKSVAQWTRACGCDNDPRGLNGGLSGRMNSGGAFHKNRFEAGTENEMNDNVGATHDMENETNMPVDETRAQSPTKRTTIRQNSGKDETVPHGRRKTA